MQKKQTTKNSFEFGSNRLKTKRKALLEHRFCVTLFPAAVICDRERLRFVNNEKKQSFSESVERTGRKTLNFSMSTKYGLVCGGGEHIA